MAGSEKNHARQMLMKSAGCRGGSGVISQRLRKVDWSISGSSAGQRSVQGDGSSGGGGGGSSTSGRWYVPGLREMLSLNGSNSGDGPSRDGGQRNRRNWWWICCIETSQQE